MKNFVTFPFISAEGEKKKMKEKEGEKKKTETSAINNAFANQSITE